ncbi:hypothetical protein ACFC18_54685, partial [Streptomyces sp. NPDC056121]|uniref:hypothetical protein n=1 Tax=Streptomyces sp. NPDC056121 TaxID=3345718 RepID=UPI0035DAD322
MREGAAEEAFGRAWDLLGFLGDTLAEGFAVSGADDLAAEGSWRGRCVDGVALGLLWPGGPDSARPGGPDSARPGGVRPSLGRLPARASSSAEAGACGGEGSA